MSFRYRAQLDKASLEAPRRVFVLFEDRKRDLSGLLEFGTVVQVFDTQSPWQITSPLAPNFIIALGKFFDLARPTAQDYLVAVGDPIAVAAAYHQMVQHTPVVTMLRWDRLPCGTCNTYRKSCTRNDCPATVTGRYVPVTMSGV